jgi:predicted membrane protein (TIGR00267 family)
VSLPALPSVGTRLRERAATLRHYHEIAEVGEIARRYFAMNAFDGVLTAVGVLVGGYLGGVDSARAIMTVMLTTAVGMGVSGFYGSYLVERAERGRAMRELEASTLSSLQDTTIAAASRYAVIVIAFVDGASPFFAALIVMLPFFFTGMISMHAAYYLAIVVAFIELFCLGMFLGAVSRERLWLSGLRLTVAGVIALVVSLLLGGGVGG